MNFSSGKFKSIRLTENGPGQLLFIFMVSVAFSIWGILEKFQESNSQYSDTIPSINQSSIRNAQGRRYCDPPNMTVLNDYYFLSEEASDDYAILQNPETIAEKSISMIDREKQKADIFFNWGFTLTFIPACILTNKYGPSKVFSYSLLTGLLILSLHEVKISHLKYIRGVITGSFLGFLIFSYYQMVFNYASSSRNRLISFAAVRHVGLAVGELLMVFSVKRHYVFYTIAAVTIVWFFIWSKIQFTSSKNVVFYEEQRKHISGVKLKTPWKDILGSRPVWMTIAVIFGASCGMTCIFKVMRLYLQHIYFLNVEILSAVSSLFHVGFAVSCGFFIHYLLKAHIVSITSSRRMIVYLSHFITAGLLFVLGFVGCGVTTPMILYCLSIMMTGANYTGAFSSPLDLAPKYSGTILAISFTLGSLGTLLMDHFIYYILTNQMFVSWRFIFSMNSLILLLTAIFFMLRGSGSVQPWNDLNNRPKKRIDKHVQHGKILAPVQVPKPRTKSIYMVEKKILKVLHVQEPDKFTRVRAYSTSLPNERSSVNSANIYKPNNKKRASIS